MADREKIIKAIETHLSTDISVGCDDCTYENDGWCTTRLLADILALLKEQERKKGSWDYGTQCSACKGTIIPPKDRKVRVNFCPWCGADMRDLCEQEGR